MFLRGAADGLNIVVPHGDPEYYAARTLAEPAENGVDNIRVDTSSMPELSDMFRFNPDGAALQPLYDAGDLLVINAAGSRETTRSHFSAMDNMDYALGSAGWLYGGTEGAEITGTTERLSIGSTPSPSLNSTAGAGVALRSPQELAASGPSPGQRQAIENMYVNDNFAGTAFSTPPDPDMAAPTAAGLAVLDLVSGGNLPAPDPNADYPSASIGGDLQSAAQLIKADVGCRAITVDYGGWDHHEDEMLSWKLPDRLRFLSEGLAAFRTDLGSDWNRTVVVVMSEFGRTVRVNDNLGTDHGHGNIMFLLGGEVLGGQVYLRGGWPGLATENLHQGQDLWITTDFRDVFAEALRHQFGPAAVEAALGSYQPEYLNRMGVPPKPNSMPGPDVRVTSQADPEMFTLAWKAPSSGSGRVPPWVVGTDIRVSVGFQDQGWEESWSTWDTEGRHEVEIPKSAPGGRVKIRVGWRMSGGGHQWTDLEGEPIQPRREVAARPARRG